MKNIVLKILGYIYKSQGKFENSTQMLSQYIDMHDSLTNLQNNKMISEMEEKYPE